MVDVDASRRLVSIAAAKRLIYGGGVLILAVSVVLLAVTFQYNDFAHFPWVGFASIALLTVVCDRVNLYLVIRRQTFSSNVAEIPMVFSLFFLGPFAFLAIRYLVGVIYAVIDRRPLIKTYVNLIVRTFETGLVFYLFYAMGERDPADASTWVVVLLAVVTANTIGAFAVLLAITLFQGKLTATEFWRLVISVLGAGALNTSVALVMVMVITVNTASIILLCLIGLVLLLAYLVFTNVMRHHRTLNNLYEFTKSIGTARQDGSLADALLVRTRELLDAESATLWLPSHGRHAEVLLVAREDSTGLVDDPHGEGDPIRRRALETGKTVALTGKRKGDAEMREALQRRNDKEVIVVPLRSGSAVIGCIEVANRLGEPSTFVAEEIKLLETLAAHAAVAVENSRLVDRLRHDAYHDALTGLANRRRFATAIEAAVQIQPAPGEVVAILQFDVDSLRDVNETLGHEAGDRVLVEVGRRLRSEAPDGALVARMGGDEFAVLLRAQGADDAQANALSLQNALVPPLELDNFTLDVGAAVGIAIYPEHATDAVTLLQRADVATYAAKNNPRSVQVYHPAMESRSLHRLGLVSELRKAIDDGELTVYYQPKVALADRELVGMECLVRWEHAEHGLVPPDDFISIAEHTGLIGPLTRLVLRTALAQCRQWQLEGRPLGVSVNLSPRSLLDADFPDDLDAMLREAGVPPQSLTLEITESAMVGDADRPLPTLRKLFTMGVRLSVDDFGTGYSSLSYLRRLPVHEVKIDKSFVLGMATDSGDLGIVRAIVDLGRHLGMTVVAEGVESEMTLTLLEDMGCDIAQGFLFSRPLQFERIEAWMHHRTELTMGNGDGARRLRVVTS